jgi:hypothetical protein
MTTILAGTKQVLLVTFSVVAGAMALYPAQAAAAPESVTAPTFLPAPAVAPNLSGTVSTGPATGEGLADAGLAAEEAAGLQFMIQEEKMAHDLYLAFYGLWGLPVFERITASEAAHKAAVARLLNAYGVENPIAEAGVGVFADPDLQALHDQLLADGSVSAEAALRTAILVEETDIKDLKLHLAATDEAAIQRVYTSLLRGSTRHLSAFSRQGDRLTEFGPIAPRNGQFGTGQGRGGPGSGRGSR